MYDTIEKIGKSTIQHGKNNNRIYLMKLARQDYPAILEKMDALAAEQNYAKIFTKIPAWAVEGFKSKGYIREARIPDFYLGKEDAFFYSKFRNPQRARLTVDAREKIDKNIKLALKKQKEFLTIRHKPSFRIKKLRENDIPQLAGIYGMVFKSYPFPIFDKTYLKKTIGENVFYFGAFSNGELVAASSAEMDSPAKNAEMTDFATHPEYTGNNLSLLLLREMEAEMRKQKMKMLYTIARSFSPGMNITFAKLDYKYSGTLINNTHIYDKIESMNVWFKSLA